jgi:16S rRNA (guanine527-N7)-methyltransferase
MNWDDLPAAAAALGAPVDARALAAFRIYAAELLRWNRRVNLTRVVDPGEVVELHFLDSLAAAPLVRGPRLLDLGAGAGFPGVVLKLRDPSLELTLVDAEKKKVSFLKALVARLDLSGARALRASARGEPSAEGIGPHATVISRAFLALDPWLDLARAYCAAGGRIICMLGRDAPGDAALQAAAAARDLRLGEVRRLTLPAGQKRVLAAFDAGA